MATPPVPEMPTPQAQIKKLVELVGPTLAALTTGAPKRAIVEDWVDGSTTPDDSQCERAALALEMLGAITKHESAAVARQWFIGANTFVEGVDEEMAPALAIREGHYSEVRTSAAECIADTWS